MTDHDWLSAESIETATDGIRAEATKWHAFSDTMGGVAQRLAGLTLVPTAFAVIDHSTLVTMTDQHGAYTATHSWLTGLLRDAAKRFDEMGGALKKCADEYDRSDGQSADTFDEIAKH